MSLRACKPASSQLQPRLAQLRLAQLHRQRAPSVRPNAAQERPVTFYDPCVPARLSYLGTVVVVYVVV